jgi:hypothetical protein
MDNYKLTIEQSDAIDAYQKGLCAVCGRPEHVPGRRLANDHAHLDGLIRGHLCSQCNPLLGKLENAFIRLGLHKVPGLDFVQIVENLAAYVKNPPATAALGQPKFGYPGKTNTKKHRKMLTKLRKVEKGMPPLVSITEEPK